MDLLLVGRIYRAHGVKGDLKVVPETDDPERFEDLEEVFVGTSPEDAEAFAVEAVRYQYSQKGVTVVLKLAGVSSREAADALRRRAVYADAGDLPPLEEGEVYLHDLIGLAVVDEAGEAVGTVEDVLDMPAHHVYVVSRPGRPDAMIPAVPAFIAGIDLEAGRLVVRPIEGLLD